MAFRFLEEQYFVEQGNLCLDIRCTGLGGRDWAMAPQKRVTRNPQQNGAITVATRYYGFLLRLGRRTAALGPP